MAARSHANGDLRPARRPEEPRIRVPPNRVEKGSGSAGLRPASRGSAKPASITPRHTNVRTAPPFESRSARPLAAPATRAVPSDRHRGPKSRAPAYRRTAWSQGRGSAGLRPASRESAKPAPITPRRTRSRYCDMFGSTRPRYSDMFPGQIRLLRHVRPQPIPLERHVPRQIPLLRHVRLHPIPLQRHVPPTDPATATCSAPTDPATATCSPADLATATCSPPTDPARATCSPARSRYCDMFASSRPR